MPELKLTVEPGKHSIEFTRSFDAPRSLVFRAYTDPELIPRWWGPAKYATKIERLEARSGGSWRFVQTDGSGNVFAFRGVFHEVLAPERIIQTFEFEPMAGHVALDTAIFEEINGRTFMRGSSVFQSVADRDGMMESGAESGMREGYERLDRLLRSLGADPAPPSP